MTAPSKSLRPKKRTQKAMDAEERRRARAADSEGSTRSIDNLNMQERKTMTSPDKKVKKMKAGGRAGSEKPDDSKAKKSGTLATHNSRGERIRSDEAATKRPMDFTGVASQSRGHKSKSDMFSDFGRHESGGGPTPTKNRTGRAGPKVVKKKASGGKMEKVPKMNVGGGIVSAVRKLKGISDGPTAGGTQRRREAQMLDDNDAIRARFADRGTSGKTEADRQVFTTTKKAIDDLMNVDRYGKDAPKGRSFGQKTRPKKGEMKTQKGKKVTAKAYGGKMEKVKKMASGGNVCRGMGAAKRGGKFSMG